MASTMSLGQCVSAPNTPVIYLGSLLPLGGEGWRESVNALLRSPPALVLLNFSLLQLLVKNIQLEDGKMMPASQFFKGSASSALELTEAELATAEAVRVRDTFSGTIQSKGCTLHICGMFTFPGVGNMHWPWRWHWLCPLSDVPGPLGFGSPGSGSLGTHSQ